MVSGTDRVRAARSPQRADGKSLGVVIPTLNAAGGLSRTLAVLLDAGFASDVVVSDGGSIDETKAIANRFGVRVIDSSGGRGKQLDDGVAAVGGDWLMILHADTLPPPDWAELVANFMAGPENERRAGYFQYALDDSCAQARRLERAVAWRCRVLRLPYGDQGLVLSRRLYEAAGGYPHEPLMEDVALIRAIGRDRLVGLSGAAVTSAERYRKHGYLRRAGWNIFCLCLYLAGVPPRAIRKLYG